MLVIIDHSHPYYFGDLNGGRETEVQITEKCTSLDNVQFVLALGKCLARIRQTASQKNHFHEVEGLRVCLFDCRTSCAASQTQDTTDFHADSALSRQTAPRCSKCRKLSLSRAFGIYRLAQSSPPDTRTAHKAPRDSLSIPGQANYFFHSPHLHLRNEDVTLPCLS